MLALQKSRMVKSAVGSVTVSMPAELLQLIYMSDANPMRMMTNISCVCQSWRRSTHGIHLLFLVHHVIPSMECIDAAVVPES